MFLALAGVLIAGLIITKVVQENQRIEKETGELKTKTLQLQEEQKKLNEKLDSVIKELKDELEAVKQAKAQQRASMKVASTNYQPKVAVNYTCEMWRPLVSQYSWNVEEALLVMFKESGCNPTKNSPTADHGLFQLHNQDVHDPAENVRIAYDKYVGGRIGSNNWSAWYAVCPARGGSPYGLKCR